jgi:glycosyltransferase involved in cell wall biosynthesis
VLREASNPDLGISVVGALMRLAYRLLPTGYRRADRILAVSEGVAAALVRRGVPARLVRAVPNPTLADGRRRDGADERGPHPWFAIGEPPVVVMAGRLSPEKNQADLLRAFALIAPKRPCRLALLGSGADRPRLERMVAELGLGERVAFLGHVDDVVPYLWRAGAVALASHWEGCPNVLIEALACEAPVVAYDCDYGPREILAGGRFGRLVRAR